MANPPRVYKTEAVVLRQRKLGEADKILTLYTPNYGKLDAVAKGSRRPTSKLAGHVEVLTHANFLLARGRNLDVVTQVEAQESFPPLREDLTRMANALYATELIERFTPERSEGYPLFKLLLETLRRLASSPEPETALRYFEVRLLDLAGYRPQLDRCVACEKALAPVTNGFSASAGGALCPRCVPGDSWAKPLSVNALKVLRLLQRGSFSEAERLRLSRPLAPELERHLRDYIRYILERDVNSSAFIEKLRSLPTVE